MSERYYPGPGWKHLLDPVYDLCEQHNVEIGQVKEKFGGLRFYVAKAPIVVFDAIVEAEDASYKTCMDCGEPGEPRNTGWILTLCDQHYKEVMDAREARK